MRLAALLAALTMSQGLAEEKWGPDQCTGRVQVQLLTYAAFTATRAAELAALGRPAEPEGAVGDGNPDTCKIRIASDIVTSRTGLCALVFHERGHLHRVRYPANLADPDHSPNPRSIMYAQAYVIPLPCMRAFPPWEVRLYRRRGYRCAPHPDNDTPTWTCRKRGRIPVSELEAP